MSWNPPCGENVAKDGQFVNFDILGDKKKDHRSGPQVKGGKSRRRTTTIVMYSIPPGLSTRKYIKMDRVMKTNGDIPIIKAVLQYDPATGVITWVRNIGRAKAGDRAGTVINTGYRVLKIMGHYYQASHVAHALMTDRWPAAQMDHKNRDRTDDRWANLREATNGQNCRNRKRRRTNRSGHKGIDWHPKYGKWRARITADGHTVHLGYFETIEQAIEAYQGIAPVLHGEFSY